MLGRLTLAAALLAAASSLSAAETCLTESSLLADQRGLVTLQASIEAACPCTAYDGSPGLGRADFRRCAKPFVDAAVTSGSLRRECRQRGRRLYRTAVCGTDRDTCGRYRPASTKKPVSCRVTPAAQCTSSARVTANACAAQDWCADVIDWTAATCIDPRQRAGAVGVRVVTMVKPSAVDPSQARTLDTVVWYPTTASGADDPLYDAIVDAPLSAAAAPYSLLLFSHGACGSATQSTFLLPLIASHGYVVASVPHPGSTIADYPACLSQNSLIASAIERPPDMRFALDTLLAANLDSGSPFFAAIDRDRVAMSGHSFGGWTTYNVAAQDARIKVAVILAGGVPATVSSTAIPSLHMIGAIDSVSLGGTDNADRRAAYEASAQPKFLVEIENAGHFAFSDNCLPGFADCNPPVTLTQDEAHQVVRRWVLPFLARYLNADPRFTPFLTPPPPPGVILDAQP